MLKRSGLTRIQVYGLLLALLLLAYGLMLSSANRKSPTVDEQSHLFRGAAYLQEGATHFLLGHPLGASILAALPLLTESELTLPLASPAWADGNWSVAGSAFLWQLNDNPHRLIFLGRLPLIWLTLLLGLFVFRWGRSLAGPSAGLAAAALLLLDPNILAHGRLITNDLPVTFGFLLTIYAFWGWSAQPAKRGRWLFLAGLGLGLASVFKYSAALLLPILALSAGWLAWRRRSWRPALAAGGMAVIAGLFIWAVYGFALRPLPGGAFWDDLFWVMGYFGQPHGAYLLGEASGAGWWYYFPVAYLLKTPLPLLLLLLFTLALIVRRRRFAVGDTAVFFLLPILLYLLASLTISLNIGYRHLLPMLPFIVLALVVYLWQDDLGNWLRVTAVVAAMAVAFTSLWQWPDYIPYFNLLAGNADQRWRLLSDSNIDWGQDLPALAAWQRETGQRLKLSYFGTAYPSAYGLDFDPLPTWPPAPEQIIPERQAYNPANPAPGYYAISATNLHGVVLGVDRDAFAWFREREPLARIGGSIFIYAVEADGPPVDVAFSGARPGNLAAELAAYWSSNDLRPRWFAAESSLIWPQNGGWLAAAGERPAAPALAALWPEEPAAISGAQALYTLPAPPQLEWATTEADFGPLAFLGWRPLSTGLLTAWRVEAETGRPLKLFVHVLDEAGEIVTQWDGLDVDPATWRPGDVLVQAHEWEGWGMAAGQALRIGVYDGETGERSGEPLLIPLETRHTLP